MDLYLKDKVAIVTGGNSGIGEAIVNAFAHEGAIPVVVGRNATRGEALAEKVRSQGIDSIFVQADLTDMSACKTVIDKTLEKYSRIDIVVNNAGYNDGANLESSPEQFMASLQKNIMHYFAMVHYSRHALIKNQGAVVNVGSKVAVTGQGGTSGYAASKGGIQALTREWAVDFLPYNVRVNEVVPAEAWTPMYESWINSFPDPQHKLKTVTQRIPLGKRMTTSEELANMVVFLASERASHITGQHIFVDGGYTHLDRAIE